MTYISVQKSLVATAYDEWKDPIPREQGRNVSELFIAAIRSTLRVAGAGETTHCLPRNDNSWSAWRSNKRPVKIPEPLCKAIWMVTGRDVTPDQIYRRNFDMTAVASVGDGPVLAQHGNAPGAKGRSHMLVEAPSIAFQLSNPIPVTSDWHSANSGEQKTIHKGHIVYGLREAEVHVRGLNAPEPALKRIGPDAASDMGETHNIEVSRAHGRPGVCRVLPAETGGSLRGYVERARLCTGFLEDGASVALSVRSKTDWIDTKYSPSGADTQDEVNPSDVRNDLISQLLRDFLVEDCGLLVLSEATTCSKPST